MSMDLFFFFFGSKQSNREKSLIESSEGVWLLQNQIERTCHI